MTMAVQIHTEEGRLAAAARVWKGMCVMYIHQSNQLFRGNHALRQHTIQASIFAVILFHILTITFISHLFSLIV